MEGACLADTMDAAEGGDALHVLIMLRAREARPLFILYAIDGVPSSHRLARIALWWYWLAMAPWFLWHALSSTAR